MGWVGEVRGHDQVWQRGAGRSEGEGGGGTGAATASCGREGSDGRGQCTGEAPCEAGRARAGKRQADAATVLFVPWRAGR
jgi:hypothetical protein